MGLVLVCLLANAKPSHASQSTQGLTPSACCQVLSVFFPKASDCFLKKPDPRAYTKAGAARGETPFSPALSLPPHLHNLSRFGCWVWVPGPGCHHLGNGGALVAMVINVGEAGQQGQKPPHFSPRSSPQSSWDDTETHSINFISERPLEGRRVSFL